MIFSCQYGFTALNTVTYHFRPAGRISMPMNIGPMDWAEILIGGSPQMNDNYSGLKIHFPIILIWLSELISLLIILHNFVPNYFLFF